MKKIKLLSIILLITILLFNNSFSQILNNSFENWDDGLPISWVSLGIYFSENVIQTTDAYEGNSAVKLEITENFGLAFPSLLVTANDGTVNSGHPVLAKYTKFKGHFKLDLKGSALFGISILMFDEDNFATGEGYLNLNNSSANWMPIEIPIEYFSDKVPAHVHIQFALADSADNDLTTVGSTVKIDNLTLEGTVTSVESNENAPATFSLDQNYPNPFNPSTTINYSISRSGYVQLSVYDMLGQEVANLVSEEQSAGNHNVIFNASSLTSGVYFYKIQADDFIDTKKMILLR